MRKPILVLMISLLVLSTMWAADSEVTAPIHQFIDGFNSGDTTSAYAAYATGDIMIVDEFAPFHWFGPRAAQAWAADLDKLMKAEHGTDARVKYGPPTRTEVEGDSAYVVVPTTYMYKQQGKPMVEKGQMTFVLQSQAGAWKIIAWTWAGERAHAPK